MIFHEVLRAFDRNDPDKARFRFALNRAREESVARPVIEMLKVWVGAHDPESAGGEFEYGRKALVVELLNELDDQTDLPVEK